MIGNGSIVRVNSGRVHRPGRTPASSHARPKPGRRFFASAVIRYQYADGYWFRKHTVAYAEREADALRCVYVLASQFMFR